MPIPGDNGHPKDERDKQNERIIEVANKGACVHKEVKFNEPAPKDDCIFGKI